ncbi:MAG: glucose-6-phosphate isomerase [Clostridia bacterium]|nr:glucose-6-phosphate isomerase [Clostridia bacterium]
MKIEFLENGVYNKIKEDEINHFIMENKEMIQNVMHGTIGIRESLGWLHVEENTSDEVITDILEIADEIRQNANAFVIVGVGGSNRAAQSVIEGLGLNKFDSTIKIYYAGNNLSGDELQTLFKELDNKQVYINVIAKDFNTLEPGIAFRMFREYFKTRKVLDAKNRIIITGSYGKGQLYDLAVKEGYRFLPFPKRVGGRFSAFTSVGLLPMAVAGVDIRKFTEAAVKCEISNHEVSLQDNIAVRYAVIRYLLSKKGYIVENLAFFEPLLRFYGGWWLQLHAESEGKCRQAILPILTSFSEDLHAIGQYLQQGPHFIFETFLNVMNRNNLFISKSEIEDRFWYLDNKDYDKLNHAVYSATKKAHTEDGIPVLEFRADWADEEVFAELMYVNMICTYLTSVFLGVEPFNQEGVENYKKNLYKELGKFGS